MITENNFYVIRTSHPLQLIEKLIRFVSVYPGDDCCCAPSLDATSFENGYPTTEELVCFEVNEERVCNSFAMCILHTIYMETPSSISICA
jgi:hypothetical protein